MTEVLTEDVILYTDLGKVVVVEEGISLPSSVALFAYSTKKLQGRKCV